MKRSGPSSSPRSVNEARATRRWIAALVFSAIALAIVSRAGAAENCSSPAALSDGWPVGPAQEQGLDAPSICDIGVRIAGFNAHAIVIARHGVLIYERYFTGEDSRWGRPLGIVVFDAATKHDIASITKSVTSLLVGIAFDRKWLKDLDAPVFSFFPEYDDLRTPEKDRITLRHLLTMSTGLDWNETKLGYGNPANKYRQVLLDPDPYRFVLAQPLIARPGEAWDYNGGATALLAAIVRRVAGTPLTAFAKEGLFDSLGIEDIEWARGANGDPRAASGLRLRPRDLAKIGQLVLQRGEWHDRQLISASWIEQSTAAVIPGEGMLFNGGKVAYGFQWWTGRSSIHGRDIDWIVGSGGGGQRLYIVPTEHLVVAVTEGSYGKPLEGLSGSTAINQVLSAVISR